LEFEVLKLGGSILKDRKAFEIVDSKLESDVLPVCVVSAMKGVTDKVIDALDKCLEADLEPSRFIDELYEYHLGALPERVEVDEALEQEFEKLLHVLSYVKSSGELSDSRRVKRLSVRLRGEPRRKPIIKGT